MKIFKRARLGLSFVLLTFLITGCLGNNYYPETPVGHFRLADQYMQAQDHQDAITVYERIVLTYAGTVHADQANFEIAQVYRGFIRDFDSAANYYSRVLYEDPSSMWDSEALYQMAGLYERDILDFSKAKLMYSRLMQEYPESDHRNEALSAIHRIQGMGY